MDCFPKKKVWKRHTSIHNKTVPEGLPVLVVEFACEFAYEFAYEFVFEFVIEFACEFALYGGGLCWGISSAVRKIPIWDSSFELSFETLFLLTRRSLLLLSIHLGHSVVTAETCSTSHSKKEVNDFSVQLFNFILTTPGAFNGEVGREKFIQSEALDVVDSASSPDDVPAFTDFPFLLNLSKPSKCSV